MTKTSFMTHCTTLSVRAICALAFAGTMFLFGGSEALADDCKHYHGRFVDQAIVVGPPCLSPLGFCVSGRAIGVLKGDFLATPQTDDPSPWPGVRFQATVNVLTDRDGDELHMLEAAAYAPAGGDLGDVITFDGVMSTGKWEGAYGALRVYGNLAIDVSDVTYDGEICLPDEE